MKRIYNENYDGLINEHYLWRLLRVPGHKGWLTKESCTLKKAWFEPVVKLWSYFISGRILASSHVKEFSHNRVLLIYSMLKRQYLVIPHMIYRNHLKGMKDEVSTLSYHCDMSLPWTWGNKTTWR